MRRDTTYHILFNLLRTEGCGLMVGEELELLWSQIDHLIRAGGVSSGPRKKKQKKIDSCGISNARATEKV